MVRLRLARPLRVVVVAQCKLPRIRKVRRYIRFFILRLHRLRRPLQPRRVIVPWVASRRGILRRRQNASIHSGERPEVIVEAVIVFDDDHTLLFRIREHSCPLHTPLVYTRSYCISSPWLAAPGAPLEVSLLPFGKFSKLLIALALLVAALLVLDLVAVRNPATRHLFSNSLDFFMVLLAALASSSLARRSQGYARQLWTLLGIALYLEALAQAIATYYQSFVPGSSQMPVPSDILFFVWAAPVFMMFLPVADEKSR